MQLFLRSELFRLLNHHVFLVKEQYFLNSQHWRDTNNFRNANYNILLSHSKWYQTGVWKYTDSSNWPTLITLGKAGGGILEKNPGISVTGDWLTVSPLTDEVLEHSWEVSIVKSNHSSSTYGSCKSWQTYDTGNNSFSYRTIKLKDMHLTTMKK